MNKGSIDGVWQDLSGNGNHGQINGATWQGNSLSFDGINDYVDFGKQHFYENVTMEVMMSVQNVNNNLSQALFTTQEAGGYGIYIKNANLQSELYADNNWVMLKHENITSNKLMHVIYTYDGTYQKLYIDGKLVSTSEISGTVTGPNGDNIFLTLGANCNPASYADYFKGNIYSAKLYSRALTEGEVLENYKLDKEKYNPDIDYVHDNMVFHLDGTNPGNNEGIWQDISGNDNHGQVFSATYNGKDGFIFDSVDDYIDMGVQQYPYVTVELVLSNITTSYGSPKYILSSNTQTSGNSIYLMGSTIYAINYLEDGTYGSVSTSINPSDTMLVTYTYDGTYEKLYIDGKLVSTGNNAGKIFNENKDLKFILGAAWSGNNTTMKYKGTIHEARLYSKALNEEQIKQNYQIDKEKYKSDIDYVNDNMVFHLDGTNPGNNEGIWQDISGNDNHGQVFSATYNGKDGFIFDSVDDYIDMGVHNYSDITIDLLLSLSSNTVGYPTYIMGNANSGSGFSIILGSGGGYLYTEQYFASSSRPYSVSTSISSDVNRNYMLITYTYDGTNMKIYQNGKFINSTNISSEIVESINSLILGNKSNWFDGTIHEVRLYSNTLSEGQIKQNYSIDKEKYNIDSEDDNLIIHLDGTNKGTVDGEWQDLSGNGNHGAINGATWNGNGLTFDGVNDYVDLGIQNYPYISMEVVFLPNKLTSDTTQGIAGNWNSGGYGLYLDKGMLFSETYINDAYSLLEYSATESKITVATYIYNGTTEKLYVDGKLVQTKDNVSTGIKKPSYENMINLLLGANPEVGNSGTTKTYRSYFDGTIYSFKLYDVAITEEQVKQNYSEAKSKFVNEYNIQYYHGAVKLDGIEPNGYVQGETIELGTTEIEGYTFDGWYTNKTLEEATKKEQILSSDNGNIKLYGKFIPNEYTINFESNGGSEVESITGAYGSEVELPVPTKENSEFDGWYLDEALEQKATNNIPLGDTTYYAKWKPAVYKINYYNGLIRLELEPNEYTFGEGAILPTEVEGYILEGWYTSSSLEEDTKISEITAIFILLVATIFVIVNWSALPEQIPSHYDFKGEPDDCTGPWHCHG